MISKKPGFEVIFREKCTDRVSSGRSIRLTWSPRGNLDEFSYFWNLWLPPQTCGAHWSWLLLPTDQLQGRWNWSPWSCFQLKELYQYMFYELLTHVSFNSDMFDCWITSVRSNFWSRSSAKRTCQNWTNEKLPCCQKWQYFQALFLPGLTSCSGRLSGSL